MPKLSARAAGLLLLQGLAAASLLGAASQCEARPYDYTRLYQSGRKAVIEGYPRKALFYLTEALKEKETEGEPWVVTYGHHKEPYLPHFYLGVAFFELGQYQSALDEWTSSEQQGAIRETEQYKQLLEKRRLISREILPHALEAAREELRQLADFGGQANDAIDLLLLFDQGAGDLGLASERIAERSAAVKTSLAAAGGGDDDFRTIEAARQTLSSLLVEEVGILRRVQTRTANLRASDFEQRLSRELDSLSGGQCSRDSLSHLGLLQRFLAARAELRSDTAEVRVSLGLARASLQCNDLDGAAEQLLALSQMSGAQEEASRLEAELSRARSLQARQDLEDSSAQEAGLADFTEAAAAIDSEECDHQAIERMQQVGELVRARKDRRQFSAWIAEHAGIPYIPQFYLAKAYKGCGDFLGAVRSLDQSRERLEVPLLDYERQMDEIESWVREKRGENLYSGSYALIILVTNYSLYGRGWPNLRISEEEQEKVEAVLRSVGFSVVEILRDPTKRVLEQAVDRFINSFGKGGQNRSRLLIYFAGHGFRLDLSYRDASPLGFLVPVDGDRAPATKMETEKFIDSAVGMDQFEKWARQIEAVHALFVLDSCYSGTVFQEILRTRGGVLPAVVEEAVQEPVRFFITASNDVKTTPDTTFFLDTLLSAVAWEENADYDKNAFLTSGELCLFLQDRVTPRSGVEPQCGKMPPPYNRGDVVFAKPRRSPQPARSPQIQPAVEALRKECSVWKEVRQSGSAKGYEAYLRQYPKGRFAGLARYRLLHLPSSSS